MLLSITAMPMFINPHPYNVYILVPKADISLIIYTLLEIFQAIRKAPPRQALAHVH